VVQVHPGPPFTSVNTRLFSLFPFSGISLKKPFYQPFINFTVSLMPDTTSPETAFEPLSMHSVQGVLKARCNSNYRTVPKHRSRSILPMRAGWIQNRFVPVEPFFNAAIRLRLRRSPGWATLQFPGHDMLWVPELTHSTVCDSSERAATRRPPVRRKDRLPYDEHTHLSVNVPRQ